MKDRDRWQSCKILKGFKCHQTFHISYDKSDYDQCKIFANSTEITFYATTFLILSFTKYTFKDLVKWQRNNSAWENNFRKSYIMQKERFKRE